MVSYVTGGVPALLTQASTALVFIAGGWMAIEGRLTLGTLIAFAAYLGRVAGPVQTLLGLYVAAQRALVSLRRVVELTAERPAVAAPALPRALPAEGRGEVRFEGVRFGYRDDAVLRGVDLVVRPGEKLGIVGLSGAGKSTLIDLLLAPPRPAGRPHPARRRRPASARSQRAAARDRGGRAGRGAVSRQPARQPALRSPSGERGAGAGGRVPRRGRRLRARAARGLCERGRHRRCHALGRPAPADRDRACAAAGPARPRARRGHLGDRRGHGGAHRPRHRRPVRGPHPDRDQPPQGDARRDRARARARGRPPASRAARCQHRDPGRPRRYWRRPLARRLDRRREGVRRATPRG